MCPSTEDERGKRLRIPALSFNPPYTRPFYTSLTTFISCSAAPYLPFIQRSQHTIPSYCFPPHPVPPRLASPRLSIFTFAFYPI
ncbi:hypothetical protein E2C01_074374 [Portunus trituberculatus]|uniref:Uncharacterized protein n=1 Tax=Portunus trituberculatus TaxID=210409 RepID=A0A5B7IE49_PORTR|nr:hypothetical protein [Portunus trituberculatus]